MSLNQSIMLMMIFIVMIIVSIAQQNPELAWLAWPLAVGVGLLVLRIPE